MATEYDRPKGSCNYDCHHFYLAYELTAKIYEIPHKQFSTETTEIDPVGVGSLVVRVLKDIYKFIALVAKFGNFV